MTSGVAGRVRCLPGSLAAVWLIAAPRAWAHGEQVVRKPWVEGSQALFSDPPSLLLLLVLALWCAQAGATHAKPTLAGAGAGVIAGVVLASAGVAVDLTLALLVLTLALGLLVAWARPWRSGTLAAAAALVGAAVVLILGPAPTAALAERLSWLAGVALVTSGVYVGVFGLLRALRGRQPGPVKQLLWRVAGSWLATAALLVLVLEIQARRG